MRGCVLLLFAWCVSGGPGCREWSGSRVRIVRPFTPQYVYLLVQKRQLCCCASRCGPYSGAVFAMLSPTGCHNHRQHTAAHYNSSTLPLSRTFQLPSFPYGPAESVSGQEVEDNRVRGKHQLPAYFIFLKLVFASCV